MRTLYWASVLMLDLAVIAILAPSIWASDVAPWNRVVAALVAVLFAALCAMLLFARLRTASSRAAFTMRVLCSAVPVLWLAGSFDHGMVSGLELVSVVLAALYAWANWKAFAMHVPQPGAAAQPAR